MKPGSVSRWTDGVTAQILGMFNDLAVEAISSGTECIGDARALFG
jgi:hypothetical protein